MKCDLSYFKRVLIHFFGKYLEAMNVVKSIEINIKIENVIIKKVKKKHKYIGQNLSKI